MALDPNRYILESSAALRLAIFSADDPQVTDPRDPSKLDESVFKGKALTHYGLSSYKYEVAAQKGAAAAVFIQEKGPVAYTPATKGAIWEAESFELRRSAASTDRVAVEARLSPEQAEKLFAVTGQQFGALQKLAARRDFHPVVLPATFTFRVNNTVREMQSKNVIAKLEGSDPKLKAEAVMYMAHWDHLGHDEGLRGDRVFNGAVDNASGVAGLLELARAYTKLSTRPKRTIIFLSTTAEEPGHFGAKYYVEHPVCALQRTLAVINIDGLNPWGRTRTSL